jgi:hypothetical protein
MFAVLWSCIIVIHLCTDGILRAVYARVTRSESSAVAGHRKVVGLHPGTRNVIPQLQNGSQMTGTRCPL